MAIYKPPVKPPVYTDQTAQPPAFDKNLLYGGLALVAVVLILYFTQ